MDEITIDAKKFKSQRTIVNLSLALCALLKLNLRIINLNKSTINSNIISTIMELKFATSAYAEGAILNSNSIYFSPTKAFKTKKINLMLTQGEPIYGALQQLWIPLFFSKTKTNVLISGATQTSEYPSYNYIREIYFCYFKKFTNDATLKLTSIGFEEKNNGEIELKVDSKSDIQSSPLQLNYHKQIINIKLIITLTKDLMNKNFSNLILDLFKLSFPGITISILSNYAENKTSNLSVDAFVFFGENNSFDNVFPLIKGSSILLGEDIVASPSQLQQTILTFIEALKSKVNKDGIDALVTNDLIPVLGLIGGEIIVQEVTKEHKEIIKLTQELLNVKIKVLGNKINCVKPYNQQIPSIEDI